MSKKLSAKYYQDNKERLQKNLVKDIKVFPEKKKKKKPQYGRERYKNLLEDEKQKLVQDKKKYYKMSKKTHYCNNKKLFSFRNLGCFAGLSQASW